MADKLTELYNAWFEKAPVVVIAAGASVQCFQAGLTIGAVSMRERAMKIVQGLASGETFDLADVNDVINEIGQLSDIPK